LLVLFSFVLVWGASAREPLRGNERTDTEVTWNATWVEGISPLVPGKWFERIFFMLFENHSFQEVANDKWFNYYFKLGGEFRNFFATTHPSQPNYWALIAGDYFNINSDDNYNLPYSNVVDLLEKRKITWKGYMQDYPGNCLPDKSIGKYFRKHNPFISFDSVRTNATRCANIVNSDELDKDLAAGKLPQYSFFTPNIDNDAHNTNINFAGAWLHSYLDPRLSKFPPGTLIVITWDEDDHTEENQIYTATIGSMVKPNSIKTARYDHYSLLRTVEDNWDLGTLGRNDKDAKPVFP